MKSFQLSLLFFVFMQAKFAYSANVFPRIKEFRGTIMVKTGKSEVSEKLKDKNLKLVEKASFEVFKDSSVSIEIDFNKVIVVFSQSLVEFPGISWESGIVPYINLTYGSLRFSEEGKRNFSTILRSPVFEFDPPFGSDLIAIYDPAIPSSEVKMIRGEMEFRALNAEEKVLLQAGKRVTFRGVLEEGEVAYDVLLQGKKIPRGNLGKVEVLDAKEAHIYSEENQRKLKLIQIKEEQARIAKLNELLPGQICRKPNARLNECSWVLEKSNCIRKRCNANGVWAEETNLSGKEMIRCQIKSVVGKCDY